MSDYLDGGSCGGADGMYGGGKRTRSRSRSRSPSPARSGRSGFIPVGTLHRMMTEQSGLRASAAAAKELEKQLNRCARQVLGAASGMLSERQQLKPAQVNAALVSLGYIAPSGVVVRKAGAPVKAPMPPPVKKAKTGASPSASPKRRSSKRKSPQRK